MGGDAPSLRTPYFLRRDVDIRIADAAPRVAGFVERHQRAVARRISIHENPVGTGGRGALVHPLPEVIERHRHIGREREPADGEPARIRVVARRIARVDVRHPRELVHPELIARLVAILPRRRIPARHLRHRRHLDHRHIDLPDRRAGARRQEAVVDRGLSARLYTMCAGR